MFRLFSRGFGLLMLSLGATLTFVVALALILVQLLGPGEVMRTVTCHLGLSDDCVDRELEKRREEVNRMRERLAELEALRERLARLDHASSSYVVFFHDREEPVTVVTGHKYASLMDPATLTAGWCYIEIENSSAITSSLYIERFDDDLKLYRQELGQADLGKVGLTADVVEKARPRCQWPDGVS